MFFGEINFAYRWRIVSASRQEDFAAVGVLDFIPHHSGDSLLGTVVVLKEYHQ
jgi:hypothetical protein